MNKNIASAIAYYEAMNNKDLSTMAQYLHPEIQFVGPMAEMKGKETILGALGQILALFKTLKIRTKLANDNDVMVVYDLDCPFPIGLLRIAALLTFENDLIARLELFFDARPFEKK